MYIYHTSSELVENILDQLGLVLFGDGEAALLEPGLQHVHRQLAHRVGPHVGRHVGLGVRSTRGRSPSRLGCTGRLLLLGWSTRIISLTH